MTSVVFVAQCMDKTHTEDAKTVEHLLRIKGIEDARVTSNTDTLTDEEIKAAILYIVDETIKDEKLKLRQEDNSANRLDVDFLSYFGIQMAQAACPTTTHPTYKQLEIDIDGGTYDNNHYFNGDNDLYLVLYQDKTSTCERTYTLSFLDEDHPYLDAFYDGIREWHFNRVHDVESFIIKNNNQIEFDDSWSSSNDYDCLTWTQQGCHATTTKTYYPGQTVYVSNTWNHMMDTSNTNPNSYDLVSVP